jgi:hypothetical protein
VKIEMLSGALQLELHWVHLLGLAAAVCSCFYFAVLAATDLQYLLMDSR